MGKTIAEMFEEDYNHEDDLGYRQVIKNAIERLESRIGALENTIQRCAGGGMMDAKKIPIFDPTDNPKVKEQMLLTNQTEERIAAASEAYLKALDDVKNGFASEGFYNDTETFDEGFVDSLLELLKSRYLAREAKERRQGEG